jgi:hypothetical protein
MAINRYYDGNNFCQATGIFTSDVLNTYAPTGWYAFDGYVRYWDSTTGVLGTCSVC